MNAKSYLNLFHFLIYEVKTSFANTCLYSQIKEKANYAFETLIHNMTTRATKQGVDFCCRVLGLVAPLQERENNSLELEFDFNQTGSRRLIGASLSKAQKEGKTHFQEGEFYTLKINVINLAPSLS